MFRKNLIVGNNEDILRFAITAIDKPSLVDMVFQSTSLRCYASCIMQLKVIFVGFPSGPPQLEHRTFGRFSIKHDIAEGLN